MSASNPSPTTQSVGTRYPERPATIIVAVSLALLVLVRLIGRLENQPYLLDDAAMRNLLTLICGFVALITLWIWFCFRSVYSPLLRRIVMIAPFLAITIGLPAIVMIGSTRVIQFSGSMVPR